MQRLLLAVHDVPAVIWVEVARVTENFKEPTDPLFGLFLCLLLHIDSIMCLIEVGEDSVDQFEQLKRGFVIEFDHTKVAHEWRTVQLVNDLLDLTRA